MVMTEEEWGNEVTRRAVLLADYNANMNVGRGGRKECDTERRESK